MFTMQATSCNFQYGRNFGVPSDPSFGFRCFFVSWQSVLTPNHCICEIVRFLQYLSSWNTVTPPQLRIGVRRPFFHFHFSSFCISLHFSPFPIFWFFLPGALLASLLPSLPKNIAFYYEKLDFKARIWVREERKKDRKKEKTERKKEGRTRRQTQVPFTIARAGPLCYSRAWKTPDSDCPISTWLKHPASTQILLNLSCCDTFSTHSPYFRNRRSLWARSSLSKSTSVLIKLGTNEEPDCPPTTDLSVLSWKVSYSSHISATSP